MIWTKEKVKELVGPKCESGNEKCTGCGKCDEGIEFPFGLNVILVSCG